MKVEPTKNEKNTMYGNILHLLKEICDLGCNICPKSHNLDPKIVKTMNALLMIAKKIWFWRRNLFQTPTTINKQQTQLDLSRNHSERKFENEM